MRRVREITEQEENFRLENAFSSPDRTVKFMQIKRDPVEPEPVGTIILKAFRIIGYDQDCDGSLMARLECIDFDRFEPTGWEENCVGLYPDTTLVVSEKELKEISKEKE